MKKIVGFLSLLIFLIGGSFIFSGCTNNIVTEKSSVEKINVMVSILPQVDFVERIGGDKVIVSEMIPPGFSPATYDPSPEQLKKLQTADIYFRIGHVSFEKAQMEKLININSKMKIVDTSEGIILQKLAAHSHEDEEYEGEPDDSHEDESGNDPHIWLSPQLVKIQAEHIYNSLVEFKPEYKEYFLINYNQFISDLDKLNSKLKIVFEPIKNKTIFVFHPAFGYLASAYEFEQEAIEIEGKDPSPEHLKKIIDEAKADNVNIIFVQKQFSTKSAEAIAKEINGVVVQIDPLAKDYFDNLEKMSDIIVSALR